MKAQTTLQTAKPRPAPAMIQGAPIPRPPAVRDPAPPASKAARFDPQAKPADSAQFRAELNRRSEAPFTLAWGHGGLND
jgi:hypothetical protein